MSNVLLSVIIPHYNIPELLVRCINSIPICEDIQVIVVDDCSPGANQYKVDYPELTRPFLEFYKTPQGGSAGRARNIGLGHAKGKWITFIDADDFFSNHFYEILQKIKNDTSDILFFNTQSVMSNNTSIFSKRNIYAPLFERYKATGDDSEFRYNYHSLWGKLFKTSFVEKNHIRFDETRRSNDVWFSFYAGLKANEVKIIDDILYVVTEREGSLASSQFNGHKPSFEECVERFMVGLKVRKMQDKLMLPYKSRQIFEFSELMRKNYPLSYTIFLFKQFFSSPYYVLRLLKRDFTAIIAK